MIFPTTTDTWILFYFQLGKWPIGFFSTKEPDAHLQAIEGRPVEP